MAVVIRYGNFAFARRAQCDARGVMKFAVDGQRPTPHKRAIQLEHLHAIEAVADKHEALFAVHCDAVWRCELSRTAPFAANTTNNFAVCTTDHHTVRCVVGDESFAVGSQSDPVGQMPLSYARWKECLVKQLAIGATHIDFARGQKPHVVFVQTARHTNARAARQTFCEIMADCEQFGFASSGWRRVNNVAQHEFHQIERK